MTRVLVVDDEAGVRFTIEEVLRDAGFDVEAAADAEAALRALQPGTVDVVLSDLRMPGMDGLALLGEVQRRYPGLPVVLLTARGSERDAVRAIREGAYDYLTKPFDADVLTQCISRAGELARLRRGAQRTDAERALGRPLVGEAPGAAEASRVRRTVARAATPMSAPRPTASPPTVSMPRPTEAFTRCVRLPQRR